MWVQDVTAAFMLIASGSLWGGRVWAGGLTDVLDAHPTLAVCARTAHRDYTWQGDSECVNVLVL